MVNGSPESPPEDATAQIQKLVNDEVSKLVGTFDVRVLAPTLLIAAAHGFRELLDNGYETPAGIREMADAFVQGATRKPDEPKSKIATIGVAEALKFGKKGH